MVVDFQRLWYMLFSCKHAHLVKITTLKVNWVQEQEVPQWYLTDLRL